MQYMILIYDDESVRNQATSEERTAFRQRHGVFAEKVAQLGGEILGGDALVDSVAAHSIRNQTVTDGPFVETKEVFGGYYLIEAQSLDLVLEMARSCPVYRGGVEVRAIRVT